MEEEKTTKTTQGFGPDLHLGCGGAPKAAGKVKKACADCGAISEVLADELICPKCEGPLG